MNANFKKKVESNHFLIVEEERVAKKSGDKDSRIFEKSPMRKENNSSENKLTRLFSKEKNTVKEREFKEAKKEGNEVHNVTQMPDRD